MLDFFDNTLLTVLLLCFWGLFLTGLGLTKPYILLILSLLSFGTLAVINYLNQLGVI